MPARKSTRPITPVQPGELPQRSPIAVTVKEAAQLLGTNDKQISRGIYACELPVVRFGNAYSIAVSDLVAWFNRKKGTL